MGVNTNTVAMVSYGIFFWHFRFVSYSTVFQHLIADLRWIKCVAASLFYTADMYKGGLCARIGMFVCVCTRQLSC